MLLDANVLIALVVVDHVHHDAAVRWHRGRSGGMFATSPSTQGSLLRLLVRAGMSGPDAHRALDAFTSNPRHEFWPDDLSYSADTLRTVVGHRQVTDAYLASLARSRGSVVATFDKGLAVTHPDATVLVPTG